LIWLAFAKAVTNLEVPYNVVEFSSSRTTGGFSRRAQLLEVTLLFLVLAVD
jgi:hypothetical protein